MMPPDGIIVLTCEYPPFPGGIGTYSGRLVDAVRASGHKATVIAPAYPDLPVAPNDPDTFRILGHHWISPLAAMRILFILRSAPKDRLFLAADIRSVLLAYALRPFHRRPYRAMIHGSEVSKFKSGSFVLGLVKSAYASAEMIAANSNATLKIFSDNFGTPQRGVVAYLGVEPAWFEPVKGNFDNPQLAALPQAASVVCAVGRIEARKGQLETVRAIACAREKYGLAEPFFVIAGRPEDHSYAAAVLDEGKRLGVPVVGPGRLSDDDLKRLYQRAACHTLLARELPGKIEGFGLVLLEAAAQGCPSVATAVGGIPEVMGSTGVVTQPDDLEETARAIAAFATDPGLRARNGALSKARALTFDWAACAGATFPELPWAGRIVGSGQVSSGGRR
jgi:phosphatidyl-myo-inositol dimannoside synthase